MRAGRISDHDALIGRTLATIMAGGALPHPTTVTEQRLLELEREAFLSLLGQPKTQERIQFMLKPGSRSGTDADRRCEGSKVRGFEGSKVRGLVRRSLGGGGCEGSKAAGCGLCRGSAMGGTDEHR
jgi:hypothetical protein